MAKDEQIHEHEQKPGIMQTAEHEQKPEVI